MNFLQIPHNHYGFYSLTTRKVYISPDSLILDHHVPHAEIKLNNNGLFNITTAKDKFLGQPRDERFALYNCSGHETASYNTPQTLGLKTKEIIEFLNNGAKEITNEYDKYMIDKDCIVGFCDMKSTNQYIYAVFWGKRYEEISRTTDMQIMCMFLIGTETP